MYFVSLNFPKNIGKNNQAQAYVVTARFWYCSHSDVIVNPTENLYYDNLTVLNESGVYTQQVANINAKLLSKETNL